MLARLLEWSCEKFMCRMRIIHLCSCENYVVIPVIFSEMVSKNSVVDAPFQQKFKCYFNKISCAHCNYSNAVFCVYEKEQFYLYLYWLIFSFQFSPLLLCKNNFLDIFETVNFFQTFIPSRSIRNFHWISNLAGSVCVKHP